MLGTDYIIYRNVFPQEYMVKLHRLCLAAIETYDPSAMANPYVQTPLLNFGRLGGAIDFQNFSQRFIDTLGHEVLSLFPGNAAVLLETYHSIRMISDQYRRVTGIHYDFQVSNAVHHAIHKPGKSYTVWIPTTDVNDAVPGLVVFDKDLTLADIHRAAGEAGYIRNIPYVSCATDNKRFTHDPKYKKYLKPEDEMHIVDLLADFKIDETKLDDMKDLFAQSMRNIYTNLQGRYYITEMKAGDVLLFNSECYHGSYYPAQRFRNRINIDFRIVSDYAVNEETSLFSGKRFWQKDNALAIENKN